MKRILGAALVALTLPACAGGGGSAAAPLVPERHAVYPPPTATPSPAPTETATATPVSTPTPTAAPTPVRTPTATPVPTPTPTATGVSSSVTISAGLSLQSSLRASSVIASPGTSTTISGPSRRGVRYVSSAAVTGTVYVDGAAAATLSCANSTCQPATVSTSAGTHTFGVALVDASNNAVSQTQQTVNVTAGANVALTLSAVAVTGTVGVSWSQDQIAVQLSNTIDNGNQPITAGAALADPVSVQILNAADNSAFYTGILDHDGSSFTIACVDGSSYVLNVSQSPAAAITGLTGGNLPSGGPWGQTRFTCVGGTLP